MTGILQLPTVRTPSVVVTSKSPKLGTIVMAMRMLAAPLPPVGLRKEVRARIHPARG